ncbi:leucine zipper domain-containing protein [Parenemella sanctibonifatiensis]|uniref:DNA-binding domain-containing protein n=1 Tax=Parenemella sanctibonifatiensis TaxID=2016505 RepID=A0A255ELD0_9ACTN|nr:leucine zipper domain-containing protein [Parenemella sanctibonifatiensis]OYN83996.1 hypothetical protein CGZ92_13115 [Parenemella sanctibonifatiensis]OYN90262.1 hypothetical protein CGZ91_08850 [Parenemella sanctibonifatiensis]
MSHRNARLIVRGRELLVERVCEQGWAVAHAAQAQDGRLGAGRGHGGFSFGLR